MSAHAGAPYHSAGLTGANASVWLGNLEGWRRVTSTEDEPTDPDAVARDVLRLIGPDPQNWVPDRTGIDHNVTVVGGGQTGSAFSFALRRAGIGKVSVIDAAEDEARAGVWLTAARMNLLRTPKSLTGPELGTPAFSFQSWYEARHGCEAYTAIDRIPRTDWAVYVTWYRQFLGVTIRYGTRLLRIEPADGHFRLHLDIGGRAKVETTRKIILCTGFTGNGGPYVPSVVREGLPTTLYAHTEAAIDFAALRGKHVAVIGAAASAFDAAGVALEAGAASVRLFARRPSIAAVPITRSRGYPGAYDNYHALPDAIRWEQARRFRRWGSTPTTDAIERTVAFANFHLHLAASLQSVAVEGGRVVVRAAGESSVAISSSWGPAITSTSQRAPNWRTSTGRSCCGVIASCRRMTMRMPISARIRILARATNTWRRFRAPPPICGTSTSRIQRASLASDCRSATYQA